MSACGGLKRCAHWAARDLEHPAEQDEADALILEVFGLLQLHTTDGPGALSGRQQHTYK
jgi:hypothetical protein